MRIAIRVDASGQIGIGHFMRCLSLADVLKQNGVGIRFVSRHMPEHMRDMLVAKGYEFMLLNSNPSDDVAGKLPHSSWLSSSQAQDATDTIQALSGQSWDWLVVDHYALDTTWESAMRHEVGKIMVIDDLADRLHDCDLLLDQNLYGELERRYNGLVPDHCVKLLGPRYALLRPEFAAARKSLRHRDGQVRRILVFFGGSDLTNETGKTLAAIGSLGQLDLSMDVVAGVTNSHKEDVREHCASLPHAFFHSQVSTMADLMARSDLMIGAGGVTTWERCYLGVPSITVVIANNQYETIKAVAAAGATLYLGRNDEVSMEALATAVKRLLGNPPLVREMGRRALEVMGGASSMGSKVLVDAIVRDDHAEA
jgi:UDP-2,4-diacetamido-2,4,6-trideoxy-beta-L-altropyranose hydrolase